MKIYLVRHGESEGNAIKVHQDPQSPLSDIGFSQARLAASRFSKIPIEVVLSSDYLRTQQTAQTINAVTHAPLELTPLLREMKGPSVIVGKIYTHPESVSIREEIRAHRDEENWYHSDEENFFDVATRASACLTMLEERAESRILAVTHGLFLCMLISVVFFGDSLTPQMYEALSQQLHHKNTGITIFEYEDKHWQLLTWNDHDHLGAL